MGRIFDPAAHDFSGTHAQVPTALVLEDRIRVYYADRFADGRSYATFLDLDLKDPSRVLRFAKTPLLPFGASGTFDDDGVMPSFAVREEEEVRLYYSGWNRGLTVPYRNATGLAVSHDGGERFERLFEGPILERNPAEPYLAVTPTLLREGPLWRMWYISGLRWVEIAGRLEPVYVIKEASSLDGVAWERPNRQSVPQSHPLEAFSRPSVLKDEAGYHMWYCFRDSVDYRDGRGAYRIGYARSPDGSRWIRDDDAEGLGPEHLGAAGADWAVTMTCYPFVVRLGGEVAMFFNGNGFGRSGFGWALWERGR
jgi:hypothetical protein